MAFATTGFWTGFGQTNLDRVLNYFSHTFHTDSPSYTFENFMWVMASLEAAYCDTTAAIAEKLRSRATILLPEFKGYFTQKRVGQLYEFRSKFMHGSMKIPNKFTDEPDAAKDFYLFSFDDKVGFATGLLVKTLHVTADMNLR